VVNRFGREGWRSLNLQLQVTEARRPYHNHYTDDSEASISLEEAGEGGLVREEGGGGLLREEGGGGGGCSGAVEVHALPPVVAPLPDARFLALLRMRLTLFVEVLGEPDVGDAGCFVAQQVHVRVHDHGVDGLAVLAHHVVEVKFMELESLQEVAERLRLKGG